jgi:hypothetical protein
VLALLGGVLSRLFTGYVVPSRFIFRSRFIIYGIGFGLLIGLLLPLTDSIKDQSFAIQDLVRSILISIPIGVIFIGTQSYLRFKKLEKKTVCEIDNKNSISDFAIYRDSENNSLRGRLLLTNNKLSFCSMSTVL